MFEEAKGLYKEGFDGLEDDVLERGVDLNCSFNDALWIFKEFKNKSLLDMLTLDAESDVFKDLIGVESDLYHWVYSCKTLETLNKLTKSTEFIKTGVSSLIVSEKDKEYSFYEYVDEPNVINNVKFKLDVNNHGGCAILEDDDVLIKMVAFHNLRGNKPNKHKALIYSIKKSDNLKDVKVLLQAIDIELLLGKTFWFEKSDYYTGSNMVFE